MCVGLGLMCMQGFHHLHLEIKRADITPNVYFPPQHVKQESTALNSKAEFRVFLQHLNAQQRFWKVPTLHFRFRISSQSERELLMTHQLSEQQRR